jgi:hypothetical protein
MIVTYPYFHQDVAGGLHSLHIRLLEITMADHHSDTPSPPGKIVEKGEHAEQGWTEDEAPVNRNNNLSAKIKNPLAHVSHEQLVQDVERFAKDHDMVDLTPMLVKGAFVAKDPPAFESVEGLTEVEKEAIRNEVLHKWRQPRALYFTIILCSIGAAVQGWDQTGSNGANLSFPDAFNISDQPTLLDGSPNPDAEKNQWLVGLINAAPYIASAFLGCWMSGKYAWCLSSSALT